MKNFSTIQFLFFTLLTMNTLKSFDFFRSEDPITRQARKNVAALQEAERDPKIKAEVSRLKQIEAEKIAKFAKDIEYFVGNTAKFSFKAFTSPIRTLQLLFKGKSEVVTGFCGVAMTAACLLILKIYLNHLEEQRKKEEEDRRKRQEQLDKIKGAVAGVASGAAKGAKALVSAPLNLVQSLWGSCRRKKDGENQPPSYDEAIRE